MMMIIIDGVGVCLLADRCWASYIVW